MHTEIPTNEGTVNDEFSEAESMKSEIEMRGLSILTTKTEDSDEGALVNVSLYPDSPSSKEAKVVVASPSISDITEVKLIGLATALILTLYLTSYLWIQVGRGTTIGAIFFFYILVIVGILLPIPSTNWIRLSCKTVLVRAGALLKPRCSCIHGKPKPVPFIDVFFADGMCSMSKVFFDWGMLWLIASHYPNPVPPSLQSIIVPSCFASLPYLIRARQCLIMYNVGKHKKDPKRYQHVLNAIKYSTSLFPLILSAFQKTTYGQKVVQQSETLLIVLLIVNATYCLAWDIVMDWGMMQNPNAVMEQAVGQCIPSFSNPSSPTSDETPDTKLQVKNCLDMALRPRLRFGTSMTLVVVFLDTFLRFSWSLRFYESAIFPSHDSYILCTEFLEVFRRAVWNLLRVEWEHIKQTRNAKKSTADSNMESRGTQSLSKKIQREKSLSRERKAFQAE